MTGRSTHRYSAVLARPAWPRSFLAPLFSLLCALCVSVVPSSAGEPTVRNLAIRGLRVGGTTTLVLDGDEFGASPRLLLPFAAKQQLQAGATKTQARFDVTLDNDVPPGYHHLRVVTDDGVSAPVVIAVDRLPQVAFGPSIESLPAALHGTVSGSATVETKFTGKAGQKILIEAEAQRLGSKLRPVVHLIGPKRLQVAWSWPTPALSGDTRLEATLPEDGPYTITIHDLEYAAAGPSFFRLRVGQWACIEQVFPPAVARGAVHGVELLGPGPAVRVDLPAAQDIGPVPIPLPRDGVFSGPRPFVLISPHAEVVRTAEAGKTQDLPAGPVGVSGRIQTPAKEQRYRIPVTPRTRVRLEVFAERIGSPLDAALVVRNEAGAEVARNEDSPGTLDPVLDYTVPDKVTALLVAVLDSQRRAGPLAVYRLVVTPQGTGANRGGFQLVTPAQHAALPVGGQVVVPVLVERTGYEGRIDLSAEGLPAGVRLEGADIPAEADGALVTVRRGDGTFGAVVTRWRGKAADGEEQAVVSKGHPLERLQPWLATEIALASTAAKAADFQIDWRGLPADAGLLPAGKLALPVKVTRPAGKMSGPVRLTLLTSQARPVVNGRLDPNQSLRLERPVELAPAAADGDLSVIVPALLAAPVYDVTVQAELLSADKRTVLATAYAPVRRLNVRHQVALRLDGPARIDSGVDPKKGGTVKIQGQVERREGLTGDVTLTLAGLPAGITAAPDTVKAGVQVFTINVVLPANVQPGEITGKLSGTAVADPKQPNVRVRSRDVAVTLLVRDSAK
jgi:hypothetical protein